MTRPRDASSEEQIKKWSAATMDRLRIGKHKGMTWHRDTSSVEVMRLGS